MTSSATTADPVSRLLVVDDDEGLLILIADALESEGYEVETSCTGRGALERAGVRPPDLMLLDLKLTDIEAADMIGRLTEGETRVPFIIVTGQGDERVAVEMMKRGAMDYVMKDGALLDLLPAVVRRALAALGRERALAAARAEHARLEGEVLAASERERHSIGADLHDGLGQLLTAVEFMCTALKEDATRTQPEFALRLDQMGGMLREAVAQTRFLARGLVPISGGPEALRQGLSALAERTNALGGHRCKLTVSGDVDVPDAAAAGHLYRIAQEAVNNAVRHARADFIRLRLARRGPRLILEVSDDGTGLPPKSVGKGAGLGLMRHRAELIGADLLLKARRGGGLVVTCIWPKSA